MGWLAQDNRRRARDALPYLATAVDEARRAGGASGLDEVASQVVLELATAALASQEGAANPANRRRITAFVDQIARDIITMPPDLVFPTLAFVSIADSPDRAFQLWDMRLSARPPQAGSGVAPDRETGAAYLSWPFASMTRLHRDPRIFKYLARYPILRNEPFPNEAGAMSSMLQLMADRPPDFCAEPGFPYACKQAIQAAMVQ